jgi:hypothetical protein
VDLTETEDFAAELGARFRNITETTTRTCEYAVPSGALFDPGKVNVEFTPSKGEVSWIPQDPPAPGARVCQGANGWQYASGGRSIVLCGQACTDLIEDPGADVRVVFGCRDTVLR